MMTQPEYWALYQRYLYLDHKDDENTASPAERAEQNMLAKRINMAYRAKPSLDHSRGTPGKPSYDDGEFQW